jgi:glycine/D-amino acid oxidase-like deaminating enzyme
MIEVSQNGPMNEAQKVVVIGAGIVGVVSALFLRREGFEVVLIDRDDPGEGCSFGNAGLLARSSFVPLAGPDTFSSVPKWLIDPNGPLSIRWSYLPKLVPWLYRYVRSGLTDDLEANGAATHVLTEPSVDLYLRLAEEAGCSELVKTTDYLQVYRSKSNFDKARSEMDARRKMGFQIDEIDGLQIQQLEPNLSSEYQYAYHIPDHGYVLDPGKLVKSIAALFLQEGGVIQKTAVSAINVEELGHCHIVTDNDKVKCDKVILAAGAFSARLASSMGIKVPLETERGYHITCPDPVSSITRPVMEGDRKFLATPMAMGLRFAGTVELAGLDAAPNNRRVEMLTKHAKRMVSGLNVDNAESWMGFRPTLPDSLPMIGKADDAGHVVFAFGHQHLGLTCAPKTAALVTDVVSGRTPNIDMAPYTVNRFI